MSKNAYTRSSKAYSSNPPQNTALLLSTNGHKYSCPKYDDPMRSRSFFNFSFRTRLPAFRIDATPVPRDLTPVFRPE